MLTEFEVRQRMEDIQQSQATPFRKVRMLLRIGKSLKTQGRSLRLAKRQLAKQADRNTSAILTRMEMRTSVLHEDVREAADDILRTGDKPHVVMM